ncbi:hypothetical protein JRQ81_004248 [Phrynocephalus forsythii]|uniref:Uncharacterized protein n=1 Tax=Phrynocephalus forsythii TaxID=171643 RepID=A0A9Q1B6C0_9SAUR|nr:hypothetical protein JRQ81_004248 [Phrynocephalus forsythii]
MCNGESKEAPPPAGCSSTGRRRYRWPMPTTALLLLAYLGYLLLGSLAFWALEAPAERNTAGQLLQERWDLLENYTCLEREALERLAKVAAAAAAPARGKREGGVGVGALLLGKREANVRKRPLEKGSPGEKGKEPFHVVLIFTHVVLYPALRRRALCAHPEKLFSSHVFRPGPPSPHKRPWGGPAEACPVKP